VYLLTGHGVKHKEELELSFGPDFIASDIYEAAV
jgi:hypothetical protein